jgi:lactaldehyde reductase
MAVNRFVLNGISYHGHGAINEIPGIVKSKGFKKAFVASDPDLVKFGVTAKVTDLLKENGIEYELYSDIKPNPTIENVLHGVDAYKASEADFMITIGGGSSMDTGKAIGIIINNPRGDSCRFKGDSRRFALLLPLKKTKRPADRA